jgi:hypothetical protein
MTDRNLHRAIAVAIGKVFNNPSGSIREE